MSDLKGSPLGLKGDLFSLFINRVLNFFYVKFEGTLLWFQGDLFSLFVKKVCENCSVKFEGISPCF